MNKTKFNINWSNVAVFIMMILTIAVGSLVIPWLLQDTERSRNVEAHCKSLGGEMGYSKCYKDGRAEEIRRAAHKRFYSINSLQNRDARFFEMYNLADDLDSASIVYDPTANKLSRKDIERILK